MTGASGSGGRRVLVGRFFHESHAFNPRSTLADAFEVTTGQRLLERARGSGSTLGGIIGRLDALGWTAVPTLSIVAPPSGLVEHCFYVEMRDRFLDMVRREPCDAVALELHGAMGTTALPDSEGDLLPRLREVVGPDVPIGIGLDLHAHVTPAMLGAVDLCIACKENPHSDVVACGTSLVDHLDAVLAGRLVPVMAMAKVPMILPGAQETGSGPLAELHAEARAVRAAVPAIRDISLFNVFRAVDDQDIGQAVVVLANGDAAAAGGAATRLARRFWQERARFRDALLSIEEALDAVALQPDRRPFALADMGDRVLAGAPGDSTAILQRLLDRRDRLRGAVPVTDPEAAAIARAAGPGATVTLAVGGRLTPGFAPFALQGVVVGCNDGGFTMKGPYQAGESASHGPAAVLLVDGRVSVLLASKPSFTHDPAAFTSQGIDHAAQDLLVVKSGYHFKLNFAGLATPLEVATPGLGSYVPGRQRWQRARFWPEHEVDEPAVGPQVFARRVSASATTGH